MDAWEEMCVWCRGETSVVRESHHCTCSVLTAVMQLEENVDEGSRMEEVD